MEKAEADYRCRLLAGGLAGCIAKTVVAPFDRVKIHFQVNSPLTRHLSGTYAGVFRAVAHIYRAYGFRSLFAGHSMVLARIFPYSAINYALFAHFRHALPIANDSWRRFVAGSAAGVVAVALTYPLDLAHSRLAYRHVPAAQDSSRAGVGGWRGLYRGLTATLIGMIPYAGTSFFVYSSLKEQQLLGASPFGNFVCGLAAGLAAQTVAYPFDVLRRRIQIHALTSHLPRQAYARWLDALWHTVGAHGWRRGLLSGLSINYLKTAPATGVSFAVYEYLVPLCNKGWA